MITVNVKEIMPGSTVFLYGEPLMGNPKLLIGRTVIENEATFYIKDSRLQLRVTHPDLLDFNSTLTGMKNEQSINVTVIRTGRANRGPAT